MGCKSSKVGHRPVDVPLQKAPTGAHSHTGLTEQAVESRPAVLAKGSTKVAPEPRKPRNSGLRIFSRHEVKETGGETIVDESGLVMRTPRRPSERSLHVAARSGDLSLVQNLLRTTIGAPRPAVTIEHTSGQRPLALAKTAPNTPLPIDIDERGMWGNTALHVAAQYAHEKIALALVENGADVCAANERGATPLLYACAEGTTAVGRALMENGAPVDPPTAAAHHARDDGGRTFKSTPLISAAQGGHGELVRLLLEHGATVDRRVSLAGNEGGDPTGRRDRRCTPGDGEGTSALMGAARNGHTDTCLFLVDAGASLLARDNKGHTALMHAIDGGYEETAKALLDTARSVGYARALAYAGETSAYGWDGGRGLTPLHLSCGKGMVGIVSALLATGVGVEGKDSRGTTSLLYATREGQLGVVRELLARGADPSAVDFAGDTPLKAAETRADMRGGKELLEILNAAEVSTGKTVPPAPVRIGSEAEKVHEVQASGGGPLICETTTLNVEEDEGEDVLLVDDWSAILGSKDAPVSMEASALYGPEGGNINTATPDSGRAVEFEDGDEDNDVLWVGDYVPENASSSVEADGDGFPVKAPEAGGPCEGMIVEVQHSIKGEKASWSNTAGQSEMRNDTRDNLVDAATGELHALGKIRTPSSGKRGSPTIAHMLKPSKRSPTHGLDSLGVGQAPGTKTTITASVEEVLSEGHDRRSLDMSGAAAKDPSTDGVLRGVELEVLARQVVEESVVGVLHELSVRSSFSPTTVRKPAGHDRPSSC